MNVDVNPKILIWAREERGMSIDYVANKLKLETSDLNQWELNGKDISFSLLESIARLYKRQTALFFSPEVPAKIKKPNDCRNLSVSDGNFSPETMLAIRRTERYIQIARQLLDKSFWDKQYNWMNSFTGRKENINKEVELLTGLLGVSIGERSARKPDVEFRNWRSIIENKLGIFIFQFPMSENELDGFSYAFDDFPHAIVVNNQNAPVRKIFTIFHELSHILKHYPGACKPDYSDKQLNIEYECNSFAGKFLVPAEILRTTDSVDDIFGFARSLNVSGEVYLRRLFEENKISRDNFFELLDPVKARSNRFRRKKIEGFPSMIIQSKSTRGEKFFNTITVAATSNKISYSTASDLLGLKVGNIHL